MCKWLTCSKLKAMYSPSHHFTASETMNNYENATHTVFVLILVGVYSTYFCLWLTHDHQMQLVCNFVTRGNT